VATPKYAGLAAACQFKTAVDAAWILQKGSPIYAQVKEILAQAEAEGKFKEWEDKNVVPTMGGVSPSTVPPCADF
jgi:hypothetical protein